MIVCRKCGFHNGDADAFCGSCGSFLEWTGEKVTPKAAAAVVPEAVPEPEQTGPKRSLLARAYLTATSVISGPDHEVDPPAPAAAGRPGAPVPGRPATHGASP
jgi:hypothetical protein